MMIQELFIHKKNGESFSHLPNLLFLTFLLSVLSCKQVEKKCLTIENKNIKNSLESFRLIENNPDLKNIHSSKSATIFWGNGIIPFKEVKLKRVYLGEIGLDITLGLLDFNNNGSYENLLTDKIIFQGGLCDSMYLFFENKKIKILESMIDTFCINQVSLEIDFTNIDDNMVCINQIGLCNESLLITDIKNLKTKTSYSKVIYDALNAKKLILLDFWFMECSACLEQLPKLNKLSEKYKNNLTIIGVNGINSENDYLNFLRSSKLFKYENVHISKDELNKIFDVSKGFPKYMMLSNDGKFNFKEINIDNLEKELNDIISN